LRPGDWERLKNIKNGKKKESVVNQKTCERDELVFKVKTKQSSL